MWTIFHQRSHNEGLQKLDTLLNNGSQYIATWNWHKSWNSLNSWLSMSCNNVMPKNMSSQNVFQYLPMVAISLYDCTLSITLLPEETRAFWWIDTFAILSCHCTIRADTTFSQTQITWTGDMHVFTGPLTVSTVTPYHTKGADIMIYWNDNIYWFERAYLC